MLLGGRTAEEIALGGISTGAQNDLQRATDMARAMVTEWGMSDALGAINYDGQKRSGSSISGCARARPLRGDDGAKRSMTRSSASDRVARQGAADPPRPPREARKGHPPLLEMEVMEGDELRQLLAAGSA